ncbi:hypothetical protein BBJ28_00010036 [Nothophytophthora sp. Chile5]|nr:hypothetical protein BBJ28_00010036 [Nothophytophthora sp. Chile5]
MHVVKRGELQHRRADCTEEKPETSEATSSSSLHEHALLPLVHRLMAMVSQPAKLLAALVAGSDGSTARSTQDYVLEAKAAAYQRSQLRDLRESWHRIVQMVERRDLELELTDATMMKAALHYWQLWQYVCAVCIDAVLSVERAAMKSQEQWPSVLQKRRAASISPIFEDKSSDALSQGMVRSTNNLSKRSRLTKQSNEFMIGWFLAHKDNPYPSATERTEIAEKTGLAEQQVRNWFANMRKRHWKPNRLNTKKPRCLLDYVLRKHET